MSEFLPNLERALMEGRGFADEFRKLMKIPRSTGSDPDPNEEQTTADIETEQVADSVDAINPIDKSITLHKITMDEDLLFKFSTMYLFNGITPDSQSTRHLNYLTSWIIEADKLFVVDLDAIPGRLERLQHVQVVVFINNERPNFKIFVNNQDETKTVREMFKNLYESFSEKNLKSSKEIWININTDYRNSLQSYLKKKFNKQDVNDWLIRKDCIQMGFQSRVFEIELENGVTVGDYTKGLLHGNTSQEYTINTFYADDYLTMKTYEYARNLSTLEGYNFHDKYEIESDKNWMSANSFFEQFWENKSLYGTKQYLVAIVQDGDIKLSEKFIEIVQNQIEFNVNMVIKSLSYVAEEYLTDAPSRDHMMKISYTVDDNFMTEIINWKDGYFEKLMNNSLIEKYQKRKVSKEKKIKYKKPRKMKRKQNTKKEDNELDSITEDLENSKETFKTISTEYQTTLHQIMVKKFKKELEKAVSKNEVSEKTLLNYKENPVIVIYEKTLMHYVRSLWLLQLTETYTDEVKDETVPKLFQSKIVFSVFDVEYFRQHSITDELENWVTQNTNQFCIIENDSQLYVDRQITSENNNELIKIFPIPIQEKSQTQSDYLRYNEKKQKREEDFNMHVGNPSSWVSLQQNLYYHREVLTFPQMLYFIMLYTPEVITTASKIGRSQLIKWSSLQIARYVTYLQLFMKNINRVEPTLQSIMKKINRIERVDDLQEYRGILEDSSRDLRRVFVHDKNIADTLSKIWDISFCYFKPKKNIVPEYGIGSIINLHRATDENDQFQKHRINLDALVFKELLTHSKAQSNFKWHYAREIFQNYRYLGGSMQFIILEIFSFKFQCIKKAQTFDLSNFRTYLENLTQEYSPICQFFNGQALAAAPLEEIADKYFSRKVHINHFEVENNSSWRRLPHENHNYFYHMKYDSESFFQAIPCTGFPHTYQPNTKNLEIFFGLVFNVLMCIQRFIHAFTKDFDTNKPNPIWNITNLFVENYGHICSQIKVPIMEDSTNGTSDVQDARNQRLAENSRSIIHSDFYSFKLALESLYNQPKLLNLLYLSKKNDKNHLIIQNSSKFVYGEEITDDEYKQIYSYVSDQWNHGIFDENQGKSTDESLNIFQSQKTSLIDHTIHLYSSIANHFYEHVTNSSFSSEQSGKNPRMARVRSEKVASIRHFCDLYFHPDIVESFTENVRQYANTHMKNKEKDLQTEFTKSMEKKGNSDKFQALLQFGTDFRDTLEGEEFHETNIELYTYRKSLILYCQYLQQLLESTKPQDHETLLQRTKTLRDDAIKLLPQRNAWKKKPNL